MSHFGNTPADVLDRLLQAVNQHDLEGLVSCFDADYVNETPVHPSRGFRGREQVRRNWREIFRAAPDVQASVLRQAAEGGTLWTEWEMSGTRPDRQVFRMRGVILFEVADALITAARFYVEPVDDTTGDVDQAVGRLVGTNAAHGSKETP